MSDFERILRAALAEAVDGGHIDRGCQQEVINKSAGAQHVDFRELLEYFIKTSATNGGPCTEIGKEGMKYFTTTPPYAGGGSSGGQGGPGLTVAHQSRESGSRDPPFIQPTATVRASPEELAGMYQRQSQPLRHAKFERQRQAEFEAPQRRVAFEAPQRQPLRHAKFEAPQRQPLRHAKSERQRQAEFEAPQLQVPLRPQYRRQPCRYIQNGSECPYGAKCRFSHDQATISPLRFSSAKLASAEPPNTHMSVPSRASATNWEHEEEYNGSASAHAMDEEVGEKGGALDQLAAGRMHPAGRGGIEPPDMSGHFDHSAPELSRHSLDITHISGQEGYSIGLTDDRRLCRLIGPFGPRLFNIMDCGADTGEDWNTCLYNSVAHLTKNDPTLLKQNVSGYAERINQELSGSRLQVCGYGQEADISIVIAICLTLNMKVRVVCPSLGYGEHKVQLFAPVAEDHHGEINLYLCGRHYYALEEIKFQEW